MCHGMEHCKEFWECSSVRFHGLLSLRMGFCLVLRYDARHVWRYDRPYRPACVKGSTWMLAQLLTMQISKVYKSSPFHLSIFSSSETLNLI